MTLPKLKLLDKQISENINANLLFVLKRTPDKIIEEYYSGFSAIADN